MSLCLNISHLGGLIKSTLVHGRGFLNFGKIRYFIHLLEEMLVGPELLHTIK